MAAIVCFS